MTLEKWHPHIEEWNQFLTLNKNYFKMDADLNVKPETTTGRNRNTSRWNENYCFFEIHSHWSAWLRTQKLNDNRCKQVCGEKRTHIYSGNVDLYRLCGSQNGVFSKLRNSTYQAHIWPAVPTLDIHLQRF